LNPLKNPFQSIKENIVQYLQLRYEHFRLEVLERFVNVMGYFVFVIVALFFFFFSFIFIGFGLAEWLSSLFNSRTAGYFATGGVFLLATLLVLWLSRHIIRFFAGKMALLLTQRRQPKASDEEADAG